MGDKKRAEISGRRNPMRIPMAGLSSLSSSNARKSENVRITEIPVLSLDVWRWGHSNQIRTLVGFNSFKMRVFSSFGHNARKGMRGGKRLSFSVFTRFANANGQVYPAGTAFALDGKEGGFFEKKIHEKNTKLILEWISKFDT